MSNTVSIVFIHGLLGDPRRTWEKSGPPDKKRGPPDNIAPQASEPPRKKSRTFLFWDRKSDNNDKQPEEASGLTTEMEEDASIDQKSVFWPENLLPRDIPNARIFTYGYNAGIFGGLLKGPDMNNVSQHANDLMICLKSELTNKKPIIFVAHSLGGIIVKDVHNRILLCRSYADGSLDFTTLEDEPCPGTEYHLRLYGSHYIPRHSPSRLGSCWTWGDRYQSGEADSSRIQLSFDWIYRLQQRNIEQYTRGV